MEGPLLVASLEFMGKQGKKQQPKADGAAAGLGNMAWH